MGVDACARPRGSAGFIPRVVGGSVQGGVNHAWFAKITGCWVEDSWGRASPSGRLFQWSSGDVIVFGAWVEAEEMGVEAEQRDLGVERTALLMGRLGALRQTQQSRMTSRESGRGIVG